MQALCVHKVGLSSGDYNDGAGDGDGRHGSMGDCVSPVGIADALIIAVDSSLVWSESQRQDGCGKSRNKDTQNIHHDQNQLLSLLGHVSSDAAALS